MAKIKSFGERIVDALVEDGLLDAGQVAELLEQQKKRAPAWSSSSSKKPM